MTRKKRPTKPYPDFPLCFHPSGQWCKKIRGKLIYFGKDPHAALSKYLEERDDLQAGRTPRVKSNALTLRQLVNKFLAHKRGRITEGELTLRTWRDYYDTCEHLVDQFGKDKPVEVLHADDFEALRVTLAKKRGPVAMANEIQRVRTIFKFAFDAELIDKPTRFGTSFKKPSRKRMRKAKQATGGRTFDAAELSKIIAAANPTMRAMVLLGANAGFGQTDVANLPVDAIDFKAGWIDFARVKTAIDRRIPLWPETADALRNALADQPDAKDPAHSGLAFITKYGHPWVQVRAVNKEDGTSKGGIVVDSIGREFIKLLDRIGLKKPGRSFYGLRHTFRTIAGNSKDERAIDAIMGHAREDMGSKYTESIPDDRLKAVTDCVRSWLFAPEADPNVLPFQATAG